MEEVLNLKDKKEMDKLEIAQRKRERKRFEFISKHKTFTTICLSFIILAGINFYLIFSFMKMLDNFYIY